MRRDITKALLHKYYCETNKSGEQVARELGIPRTTLGRYLDKFGIKKKTLSEVMTGKTLSPEHRAKVTKTLINGNAALGDKNPAWKGGRTLTTVGYVWIKSLGHPYKNTNGYVLEHRLVVEKKLGRYLLPTEHIHHINENKGDNRIENLRIVTAREHAMIHWGTAEAKKKQSIFMKKVRKEKSWSTRKK